MLKTGLSPLCRSLVVVSLLSAGVGAGCGPKDFFFDDDEGNFTTDASGNLLSSPYALGAKVSIAVAGQNGALVGWRIESSNPAVLSVDKVTSNESGVSADCTAQGEGDAQVRLIDAGGAERRAATVTVKTPDGVRLYASGLLRLLDQENPAADNAEVEEIRVLTGGKGVFAVGYFRGTERLYGHGVLEPEAPAAVKATRQTSSGGRVNEWLFLNPTSDGTSQVQLKYRGAVLRTLTSIAVPEVQINSVSLVQQQFRSALKTGDKPWVLLRARDAVGRDIHGVYGSWTLDGVPQTVDDLKVGDLYRVSFSSGMRKQLAVTRGPLSAMLQVEANDGRIYETTYLGCHVAPGARPEQAGAPVLLLGALTAWLLLRRRQALHEGTRART